MLPRPPVPEHELEHDLAHFGITQDATAADPDPSRRRTFRTVDGPIGSLSVAEAVNLARVLNRTLAEGAKRATRCDPCTRCGETDYSPNVEAFEATGELVCDDCAPDAITEADDGPDDADEALEDAAFL